MKTERLDGTQPEAVARAADYIRQGRLVIFPTDTVYGIGADPFDEGALDALYLAKKRTRDKGIPILLAELADLAKVARSTTAAAQTLMERFWPGPLTLVVSRQPTLPAIISPDDTIAVRIPAEPIARALIRDAGGAVAASSANISGAAPARTADEAMAAFDGVAAAILDGGPAFHGVPSTVVDCTVTPLRVLRAGALSAADLGLGAA